jgi:hypothetical protein
VNSGARWAWRIGQLLLLILIGWGIYRAVAPRAAGFSWSALDDWRPAPGRLLLSLAILVAVYIAHALLWRRIMSDLLVGRPAAGTTVRVYFLASLGRYIPGKLWQLAGLAVLSKRAGLPAMGAAACALLGQFAFLATGFLFLAVLLPQWSEGALARIVGIALVAIAGLGWLLFATPVGLRPRAWLRSRAPSLGGDRLISALDLAERIRGRDAILWGVWYGITWAAIGIAFSLFATSFVPTAIADSQAIAGAIAASYLAGYLVLIAPAGLGVREGALAGLLSAIPSIPISAAIVIAVLSRIWFTAAELLPLLALPFLRDPGAAALEPESMTASPTAGGTAPGDRGGA